MHALDAAGRFLHTPRDWLPAWGLFGVALVVLALSVMLRPSQVVDAAEFHGAGQSRGMKLKFH